MDDPDTLIPEGELAAEVSRWRHEVLSTGPLRDAETASGVALAPLYTPLDTSAEDYLRRLGFPGEYPFTRGVYPSMYRGKLWTIRQYAGSGTADETNTRYRFLLEKGQQGLSVALDLPTQMGYDSDHPLSREEVGRVGVAIDTVADMESLFADIPLDQVSVNFTVNATAAIILAMYLVVAEHRGAAFDQLRGTLQNDPLKEFVARNTYIFPPGPSLRLTGDIIEYCHKHVPRFNPISITGYHVREAGANAVQEIAYALAAAIVYVDLMVARGLDVDDFAPRLSFHFSSQRDLFEEICKIRAARRLWARLMRERFGAEDPHSQRMRYFNGGSGVSLSHSEPLNNIVRGTLQCLAGVLSGAQACHVPSYDEAYRTPSEEAALLSVRTQQILAHESGVANVADPLGGSYFVESLTDQLEARIEETLREIEDRGGFVTAIEQGVIKQVIVRRAYELQQQVDVGERVVVGENLGGGTEAADGPRDDAVDAINVERQIARLDEFRSQREKAEVNCALEALKAAAEGDNNVVPYLIRAVRAEATLGEICDVLRLVFGTYNKVLALKGEWLR